MGRTLINVGAVIDATRQINSAKSSVSSVKSSFTQTKNSVDGKIRNRSNIGNRLTTVQNQLSNIDSQIGKIRSMVESGANLYRTTDDRVESWRDGIKNNVGVSSAGRLMNNWASYFNTSQEVNSTIIRANTVEFTEDETDAIIEELAFAEGVSKENIVADLKAGLEPAQKWLSKIDKYLGKTEKAVRYITGATDLAFKFKDGHVIVSQFTRSGVLNSLTKIFHGKGVGTYYNPSTLLKTPVVGTIYAINKVASAVEVVAGVAEGTVKVLTAGAKIVDVLNDNTKSKEKKACDITAIGVTSAAAAALDVAAPFAGKAVTTAVTALIPVPGVNVVAGVVAGVAVKGIISTAADVITSEAVVNQVSDSAGNIGNALVSGVKSVSDAGKALLESKNVGDAVTNTAKLVGTAAVASVNAVATVATETVKVAATVVAETAKTVVNKVADAGTAVVNWFKSW